MDPLAVMQGVSIMRPRLGRLLLLLFLIYEVCVCLAAEPDQILRQSAGETDMGIAPFELPINVNGAKSMLHHIPGRSFRDSVDSFMQKHELIGDPTSEEVSSQLMNILKDTYERSVQTADHSGIENSLDAPSASTEPTAAESTGTIRTQPGADFQEESSPFVSVPFTLVIRSGAEEGENLTEKKVFFTIRKHHRDVTAAFEEFCLSNNISPEQPPQVLEQFAARIGDAVRDLYERLAQFDFNLFVNEHEKEEDEGEQGVVTAGEEVEPADRTVLEQANSESPARHKAEIPMLSFPITINGEVRVVPHFAENTPEKTAQEFLLSSGFPLDQEAVTQIATVISKAVDKLSSAGTQSTVEDSSTFSENASQEKVDRIGSSIVKFPIKIDDKEAMLTVHPGESVPVAVRRFMREQEIFVQATNAAEIMRELVRVVDVELQRWLVSSSEADHSAATLDEGALQRSEEIKEEAESGDSLHEKVPRSLLARIAVTMGDESVDLLHYEGHTIEESVTEFMEAMALDQHGSSQSIFQELVAAVREVLRDAKTPNKENTQNEGTLATSEPEVVDGVVHDPARMTNEDGEYIFSLPVSIGDEEYTFRFPNGGVISQVVEEFCKDKWDDIKRVETERQSMSGVPPASEVEQSSEISFDDCISVLTEIVRGVVQKLQAEDVSESMDEMNSQTSGLQPPVGVEDGDTQKVTDGTLMASIAVTLSSGETHRLNWHEGDDLSVVTKEFCVKYGVDERHTAELEAALLKEIEIVDEA